MSQLPSATTRTGWRDSALGVRFSQALTLAKPGIVQMVAVTGAVGFTLGALSSEGARAADVVVISALGCLVGIVLSAAGANTLNQAIEHRRDAQMRRTRSRPVPSGAMSPSSAWTIGIGESMLGIAILLVACGVGPALVSLVTILTYLFWYTPLKPRTSWSTLVGAFPGALPPLIGWSAASGGDLASLASLSGWALVAIVFVWQMPHFLAIAWMYREDYARGGHRVLPVTDPTGVRTAVEAVLWAALLVPVSLAPALWTDGVVGPVAVAIAMVAGLMFLVRAIGFLRERTDARARKLFFASIIYLPVVLVALVGDAAVLAIL